MSFVGRARELEHLNKEFNNRDGAFVVVYGRRRIGKTRLIKEFIKDKNALYFQASKETEVLNLRAFSQEVDKFMGVIHESRRKYDNWRDYFTDLIHFESNIKKIIVIDEFPYLIKENSAIPSIFQWIYDELLKESKAMLILCGSHMSMMIEHLFNYSSPLYGRRTSQIKLKPLSFTEFCESFEISFERKVEMYAVTGGVPRYLEFFDGSDTIFHQLDNYALSNRSFLYEEPLFLLKDEIESPVTYLSILKTISMGNHKASEIATVLEKKSNELSPYLATLIDLGFLEKRVPVTEKSPEKSRKGLYFISDNYVRFWFKYVYPFKSQLDLDTCQQAIQNLQKDFISHFVANCYEQICGQILMNLILTLDLCFSPSALGSYWSNDGQIQIDVVVTDHMNKKIFFGECKYQNKPVDADVYFDLKKKTEFSTEIQNVFSGYEFIFGIFSKSGFHDRLLSLAKENKNVWLIDKTSKVI